MNTPRIAIRSHTQDEQRCAVQIGGAQPSVRSLEFAASERNNNGLPSLDLSLHALDLDLDIFAWCMDPWLTEPRKFRIVNRSQDPSDWNWVMVFDAETRRALLHAGVTVRMVAGRRAIVEINCDPWKHAEVDKEYVKQATSIYERVPFAKPGERAFFFPSPAPEWPTNREDS